MDKKQLYELMVETDSEKLNFLPEDVKKEIDKLKEKSKELMEKVDETYENSKVIKEYQIPQYKDCNEILIIEDTKKFVKRT